ncbi:MAG: hypothetical protein ABI080_19150, partial [Candidatus Binatia bacterium]
MIVFLPSIADATPVVSSTNDAVETSTSTPTQTATPTPALTPTSTPPPTPSVIAAATPPPAPTATSPLCSNAPLTGCRTPTAATKAALPVRGGAPSKNQLVWEWMFGAPAARGAHGDRTASDPVLLCVYDASRLVATATLPTGRRCGTTPCRRVTTTSFEYARPRGARGGALAAQLQTSLSPDETRIQLKAKGARLAGSPLGDVASPVTVQLL